ncbi:MAG: patatin-like phospholipase family protein [Ottowia sp.]|nr:patatin-like phospholipase family protein [Ottowia sp.]
MIKNKALLLCCVVHIALLGCTSTKTGTPVAPLVVTSDTQLSAPNRTPTIALVLGGGAARGFAHIGVIKALEAQGIPIHMVVGSSAGSVVAALYASGLSGKALWEIAEQMKEEDIADWALSFRTRFGGVIKGEALQNYVNRLLAQRPIEQMTKPLGIVATDLQTGRAVLFRYGNTGQAVRASSSIPGIFQPVTIAGRDYVDGGLVAPVPVHFARAMGANFVIAVNVSAEPSSFEANGLLGALLQTTAIMGQTINQYELAQADIVIRPDLSMVRSNDFQLRDRAMNAGEQALLLQLPALRAKLTQQQNISSK